MKNKFSYILLGFILITSCFSDEALEITGAISGSIKESGSAKAIEDANVSLEGGESIQSVLSDSNGNFVFGQITSGAYEVSVIKSGYIGDVKSVIVNPEKTSISSFSLQKKVPVAQPNSVELDFKKPEESVNLTNKQSDVMNFTTSTSKNWLTVSPTSGTIDPNNTVIIKITADFTSLVPETYEETMVINVGGATMTIPIKVTYVDPPIITITKPQIDEVYKMGDVMPIAWTSNLDGKVKIELLKESSIVLNISDDVINKNGGTYNWTIPSMDSAYYKILISSLEETNITNSTQAFKIDLGATAPIVTTATGAEEIANNFIKIKGNIVSLGVLSDQVNDYGHVYSANSDLPTTADNKTSFGIEKEIKSYTSNITELQSSKTYKIRAYAINDKGTSYGEVTSVTTVAGAPLISTTDVSDITASSAISGGNISSDGGASITERGLLYGTSAELTINSPKIIDPDTSTGSFTSSITGLTKGTTYYVKAFAKNSGGYGYADLKTFSTVGDPPIVETTSIEKFSSTKAEIRGKVTSNGGETLSSYGFAYGKSASPTISDNKLEVGVEDVETFNGEISELTLSTKYYVRAYASNAQGTSYGEDVEFTTKNGLPGVTTVDSESVNGTSAVINGKVDDNGGNVTTSYGFAYAETDNPTIDGFKIEIGTDGIGAYSGKIEGLKTSTKYYVKAYATNSKGTSYGDQIDFTTTDGLPKVNTVGSRDIAGTNGVATGTIVDDGGESLISYGFVYSESVNPTISGSKMEVGETATGGYSGTITDLKTTTKYYFRAYVTNKIGTSYGVELSFTTLDGMPTVSTTEIKNIGISTSKAIGKITDDGGETILAYGFVYSTSQNPTISGDKVVVTEKTDNIFEGTLSGLTNFTKYYVKAYVTNSAGTAYGSELSFTTLDGTPTVETTEIKDIEVNKAKAVGKIKGDGGDVSEYGFVYSTEKNPTIKSNKLVVTENTDNVFEGAILNLKRVTKYYVKAFLTNEVGTGYGDELSFTTKDGPYFTITSPTLNQAVAPGVNFNITWDTNITDKTLTIEHWNDGVKISDLSTNTNITSKSFTWAVPSDATKNKKHQIKLIDNSETPIVYESSLFEVNDLTYVPDDIFESWMINEGLDDVLDDYVKTANLNARGGNLELTDLNIYDLTGINSFTSINYIAIDNLKVKSIDISQIKQQNQLYYIAFSNNQNLETIKLDREPNNKIRNFYLVRNPKLKEISSLDNFTNCNSIYFSENPKLESVVLPSGYNDKDPSITLANTAINPGILSYVDWTPLKDIGMVGSIDISYNNFTDGDFSFVKKVNPSISTIGNPLTCIKINEFSYLNDKMGNITYSPRTQYITNDCTKDDTIVSDDNFEQALIDLEYDDVLNNAVSTQDLKTITKLNIPDKGIIDLTGLEAMTALKELYIEKNTILNYGYLSGFELYYKFDFSKNTELEVLSMWSINLSYGIIDLSKNTKLKTLNIQNNTNWRIRGGLDVSMLTNLTTFDATGLAVGCIKVSQSQLDNIPAGWDKDENESYGIDCAINNSSFTDSRDGKQYSFYGLGSQIWFSTDLAYVSSKSYNPYYDDVKNGSTPIYSKTNLYWVDDTGAIPSGWHIPSKEEWVTMFTALGSTVSDSGPGDSKTYPGAALKLKSKSDENWTNDCTGKTKAGSSTSYGLVLKTHRWRAVNNGSTACNEDGSLFGVTYLSSTSKMIDGKKYHYTYTISMSDAGYYDDVIERLELVSSDSVYPGDQSKNIAQGKYMIKLIKDD